MNLIEGLKAHRREIVPAVAVVGALAVAHLGIRAPSAQALQSTTEPTQVATIDPTAEALARPYHIYVPLALNRALDTVHPSPYKTATSTNTPFFTVTPEATSTSSSTSTPETPTITSTPEDTYTPSSTPTITQTPTETPTPTETTVSTGYEMVYIYGNMSGSRDQQNIRYTGPQGSFNILPAGVGSTFAEPWVVKKTNESNPNSWSIGYTYHSGANQTIHIEGPGGVHRALTKDLGSACYEPDYSIDSSAPLFFVRDGAIYELPSSKATANEVRLIAGTPMESRVETLGNNIIRVSTRDGVYRENLSTGEIKIDTPSQITQYLSIDVSSRFISAVHITRNKTGVKVINRITGDEIDVPIDPQITLQNQVNLLIDTGQTSIVNYGVFRFGGTNKREIWSYDLNNPANGSMPVVADRRNDARDVSAVNTIDANRSVEEGRVVLVDSTNRSDGRLAVISLADGEVRHLDAAGIGFFFRSPRFASP